MIADDVMAWNDLRVNTASAYKAWGIDIEDLKFRRKMLREQFCE